MGNSYDITVDKNFAYCTENSEFFRNGNPAANIGLSEEYYEGWGNHLGEITITNNILVSCYRGLSYHVSSE